MKAYIIGIILLVGIFGFVMVKGHSVSNNLIFNERTDEVQNIVIGMKNYNYYPNKIEVQSGKTIKISLDSSVEGCFRDFIIKDFGIHQYLNTSNDYIEFTPTKTGTFSFACSMSMGRGTLIVE